LVLARYERVSLIVASNKPFSAWGAIFGDEVIPVLGGPVSTGLDTST
jgi:DNA replication protein DnaC